MLTTLTIIIGIVIAVAMLGIILVLFIWMARASNKVNLTEQTDTQPEWMRSMPPKETVAATLADGEGIQVFDTDQGEALASPFAEQIEDILMAKLAAHPELQQYKVDLGTAADGSLKISVNGTIYKNISDIPNEELQAVFNEAIEDWKKL